ncbi:hypothetical protein JOC34_000484 [Virgibacillus halotolerans]|uniref:hypothetical protein n=1 Tax=Virgibacillus halotolerans TaxID=1071053 RepID=UPI0019620040|nr:hypothetical protein [Virgibacillus halotolerans]MBM7598127.1 hypothetical protein [Virgibacillus halotolerans]
MKFYTVIAHFDLSMHTEWEVKSFTRLENASKFGKEMKQKFLTMINGSKLDQMESHEDDRGEPQFYNFYGVCELGENFATIEISEQEFAD